MKNSVKGSVIVSYLEELYDKLNASFFDGKLVRPFITVCSGGDSIKYKPMTFLDSFTQSLCDPFGIPYELVASIMALRTPVDAVGRLLHEMCHQYNREVLRKKDLSREGTYHNKNFKKTAEKHGLIVSAEQDSTHTNYGWCKTTVSEEASNWIAKNNIRAPNFTERRAHNHRYVCPKCGLISRATKSVEIACAKCKVKMVETT